MILLGLSRVVLPAIRQTNQASVPRNPKTLTAVRTEKKDHNESPLIIKTRWRVASAGCSIKRLVTSAVQSALLLKGLLVSQMGATPFGGLGASNMEQMAAMGMQGANMNPQVSAWSVTYVVAPINKMSHGHFLFRPFLQTS